MLDTSCFFVKARVFLAVPTFCAAPFCSSRSPRKGKDLFPPFTDFEKKIAQKLVPDDQFLPKRAQILKGHHLLWKVHERGTVLVNFLIS